MMWTNCRGIGKLYAKQILKREINNKKNNNNDVSVFIQSYMTFDFRSR